MKICIFTHTFPRFRGDSAAPFMGNLARALGQMGHQVYVLVPFDPKIDLKSVKDYKIVTYKYIFPTGFHILGYSRTFKQNKQLTLATYLIAPLMYLFGFIALLRLVKKTDIDIVSAHWMIPGGLIARGVKALNKTPYVVTIPGADVYMGSRNRVFKEMVGVAALGADYVISDSAHYINQLKALGFHPKNINIIRYGVDTKAFIPTGKNIGILKDLGLKGSDQIILSVGRMEAKKGFIYLVRAFKQTLAVKPRTKLVFVGDGYEKARLEKEVKSLKLERNVIFVGSISYDKLNDYYNLADVFVMPSIQDKEGNTDASPVALMEAMSCGVRVGATKYSGSTEFLNGRTGFLVKEKTSLQIAQAIVKLLSNKEPRFMVQKEVRKMAEKNFSLQIISKKYIEIFRQVLSV